VAGPNPLAERLHVALDLWATGVAIRRQQLRRQHVAATEAEIDRMLSDWLRERPGAAAGDGPQPASP
jgi:hypothetical protein